MSIQRITALMLVLIGNLLVSNVASAMYDPGLGRFCSRDPIRVQKPNVSLLGYVGNSPLARTDPSGEITIKVRESSCPGCGKAAILWRFDDGGLDEWFLVQKVCLTLTRTTCKPQADGCCMPDILSNCTTCFYEKLPMKDDVGQDLWRLPWSIPPGTCGTMGVAIETSEIRSFAHTVADNDNWQPKGEIDFCDFPNINVGEHRTDAPTYWDKSTSTYHSFMVHAWDCCTKSNSSGFLSFGSTGLNLQIKSCGNGTPPKRPGLIPW